MAFFSDRFTTPGKMSFVIGGQWGSEGKGAAAAWLASQSLGANRFWDIVTTNAGAQAGHTSIHKGRKVVVNHLPTASIIAAAEGRDNFTTYLNAGCIIDPDMLERELNENPGLGRVVIHPNAAIITDECRIAEQAADSTRTKIGSTRKGVGEALARKVMRFPNQIAREHPWIRNLTGIVDLNRAMMGGKSVLSEIPQGYHLSVNSPFYPYVTSRVCSLGQALADADVHPSFAGNTLLVLRPFPIRVGHITDEDGKVIGHSGDHFHDQRETSWEEVGVPAEITTVTKRIRRVFTFSEQQAFEAISALRPAAIYMAFCDYLGPDRAEHWHKTLIRIAHNAGVDGFIPIFGVGPSTEDVSYSLEYWRMMIEESRLG